MRVLVVEDDYIISELITMVLQSEGIECVTVADGRSGVTAARTEEPDLILMDLMLPIMNGADATRQLKQDPATSEIPIIAMSAGVNLRKHVDDLPADGVLPKPFDIDALIAIVKLESRLQP